ncbi:MAG TPA: AMP-binding protein [Burkholderiales bacterium]|nr:AMP-binding protein [Burkholderiales bacterium]
MQARLHFDGSEIDPAAFEDAVLRAAGGLERLGVGEDDVVCLMLRNDPAFLEGAFGARRLGAYTCPINWHFKADEAGWILRDSGAKVIIVQSDLLKQIAAGIPPGVAVVEADAPKWRAWLASQPRHAGPERTARYSMPYTSGTTGRPKGIRRFAPSPSEAERSARVLAENVRRVYGLEPGARALLPAPMYHSAPNMYAMQAMLLGATLYLESRFDAERTLQLIESEKLTRAYLVPTMFSRMLKLPEQVRRRYDLSSMQFVITMGSPCAPEVKRAMIEWWGPVIHESYAASELGLVTFISAAEALERPGSAGRPIPGVRLKILDPEGRELPPRTPGLIYARQAAYTDFTYNNDDEARRRLEREGLWTLGDMGWVDEDGYLYLSDRAVDMVISGGANIYPAEIEAALIVMPGVADCAVFGIPDEEFGESVAAAVQMQPGAALTAESVRKWLGERIANYKVPRLVVFHERLPREDSGKLFKRKLRAPYWEQAGRKI